VRKEIVDFIDYVVYTILIEVFYMAKITCPRCGATALSVRTGENRFDTAYDSSQFVYCAELDERLAAAEKTGKSVELGDCSIFDNALKEAIASGRL
jgi:hypothetical protein